MKYMEVGGV